MKYMRVLLIILTVILMPPLASAPRVQLQNSERALAVSAADATMESVSDITSTNVDAQTPSWTGAPSAFTRLAFTRDYVPGAFDVNGQFMGGTATMFLTPHQGKLWAGIGYWNDVPRNDPSPGPQILVKEAHDAPWKVDFSFGAGYLRVDGMRSVTFTTDRFGNVLNPPVTMLLAAVSDISPPQETTVWTRAENTNVWTKASLGSGRYARMIFDYKDMVAGPNGVHYVFAADESSALYRGGYDAAAPGRIVWDPTPEITGPRRMLSAAVANGDLYLGVATDGDPTNNFGGLFKRVNGPNPSWQFVYEWPRTGDIGLGSNLRGLTAIPDPNGGGHEVLIGVLENLKQIVRIDPANGNRVTVELNLEAYFDGKWGPNAIFYYAAYNDMLPVTDPLTGEALHLIGVWARHPDAAGTSNFNNTWFMVRHANGTYEHAQVIDPAFPVPPYPGLWATRTIVPSPFPQEHGRVVYFGGCDAGGSAPSWHNTAWIYRGRLRRCPDGATGDLDGDGRLSALDLLFLQLTLTGAVQPGATPCNDPECADLSGDGDLDTLDVVLLAGRLSESEGVCPRGAFRASAARRTR
jgi:hypothetical protein